MSMIQPTRQQQANQMAMFLHLSQLLGHVVFLAGFVAPIIIWVVNKDKFPEIEPHAKMVLNWSLSAMIYYFIAGLLCLILVGFILLPVIFVASFLFAIIGAMKAGNGELYQYPFTIRFIS